MSPTSQNELIGIIAKYIIQKRIISADKVTSLYVYVYIFICCITPRRCLYLHFEPLLFIHTIYKFSYLVSYIYIYETYIYIYIYKYI